MRYSDFTTGPVGYIIFFAVLAAPSVLTFSYPFIPDNEVAQWLADDYIGRLLVIGAIYAVPVLRSDVRSAFQSLTWPEPPLAWLKAGLIIFLSMFADVAIEFTVRQPLIEILPDISTFRYPRIESKSLAWFDLLFGLILVSVSEEYVYRVVLKKVIEQFTYNKILILIISSLIFSSIHSSHGIPSVIAAFLSGIILMGLYMRMGSIMPSIITHYLMNFWQFHNTYFG